MSKINTNNIHINGYNLSALPPVPKNIEAERPITLKDFIKSLRFVTKTAFKTAPVWMTIYILTIVIETGAPILAAYYFKEFVDALLSNSDYINSLIYLTISATVGYSTPQFKIYNHTRIADRIAIFHIDEILRHIADLPMSVFNKPSIQEKLVRVSTYEIALIKYIEILGQLITKPLNIVSNSIILWIVSPWLVLGAILLLTINTFVSSKYAKNAVSLHFVNSGYSAIAFWYNKFFNEEKIVELKIYRLKKFILARLKQIQQLFMTEQLSIHHKSISLKSGMYLLWSGLRAGTLLYLANSYLGGAITIGDISFYNSSLNKLRSSSTLFSYNMGELQRITLFILDLIELLSYKPEEDSNQEGRLQHILFDKISFNNISFTYPEDKYEVLKNLDLTINAGEKIAIVGRNGAGKTTLINLLLGFYIPTKGDITVVNTNETNLKEISQDSWRYSINYVPQNFAHHPFSIHENVAYGDIEELEDKKQIIDALKKADLLDDLKKRIPHNNNEDILSAYLGNRYKDSHTLSGGQYQKLAISRAFMNTKAPLAILDEPSSKLDAQAEAKLFKSLLEETGDKTVIFISHRYSTVRDADRILVVDNGNISEQGNHDELMKLDGYYAEMFKLQAAKYQ